MLESNNILWSYRLLVYLSTGIEKEYKKYVIDKNFLRSKTAIINVFCRYLYIIFVDWKPSEQVLAKPIRVYIYNIYRLEAFGTGIVKACQSIYL